MKLNLIRLGVLIGCCFLLILLPFPKCIQEVSADYTRRMRSSLSEKVYRFPYYHYDTETGLEVKARPENVTNLVFVVLATSVIAPDREMIDDVIITKIMLALELGIRRIQQPGYLATKVNVTVISRDTFCSSIYGTTGFYEIYTKWNDRIDAVFGLSCDYVLAPIARACGVWDIPILTSAGRAQSFDTKTDHYLTVTRILGGHTDIALAIIGIMDDFNWTKSSFLFQNNADQSLGHSDCYHGMKALQLVSKEGLNAKVKIFQGRMTDKRNITEILNDIKTASRIVIMCADPYSIRQILLGAEELNMIDSGEYVFINIELFSKVPYTIAKPWYDKNDTEENNRRAKKAYTALLTITAKQPDDEEYLAFSEEIKALAAAKYNYTFEKDEPVSTFVTSFYDAVLLYAYALNDSITEDPTALTRPINGTEMVRRMWNRSFRGITGNVSIDSNGDRISAYSLLDMNPETGHFEVIANFLYNRLEYVPGKSIHWAGGRTHPPPDRPKCGFDGSLCPDNSLPGYAILSLILGFTVIIMAIISLLGYRHYKAEAEINSMTWKVNLHEVLPCDSNGRYRGSMHSLAKRGSQVTIYSEDMMGSLPGDRQLFIPVGVYKGCKVAIKQINESNISLNRSLMLELKHMKDIQHDHLVRFYGACLDPPKCFILTEYCPKGSLQDILENEQIKLDWMFKLSLMHDIVRGMHFLHQSDIKCHGNLKSSNCVVDSRFVLKVTDFGLHKLRKPPLEDDIENCDSYAYWKRLLWTAPEILRSGSQPMEGTQKGDVYSFGIIIHEIITRQGPFYLGDSSRSPKEIVELVKNHPKGNGQPFRPQIDETAYDDINQIMQKCWAEDAYERPEFGYLKATIRKINKDNETGNIVDNLLQRMEQYANNLEGLVEERTRDYLEEKKKCEKLLYQLLPQSVAAQLISGQPVIAETYDQVTIYFSDIVGFTAISAESTPMQVVSFLNDLYTCFDSIVENFDVYKVETIGDAYMVVSGLPIRNGNLHAREIARMALALLNAVYSFKIHHRPNDHLRLRIGLHSGPCVAGVVGLKMPRYCLFGDTVNTASRMESNGEPLKIHVSQSTKTCLDQFKTFIIKERGYVKMKGKGEMLTYWLEGETVPSKEDDTKSIINSLNENSTQSQNDSGAIDITDATTTNVITQNISVNENSKEDFHNLKELPNLSADNRINDDQNVKENGNNHNVLMNLSDTGNPNISNTNNPIDLNSVTNNKNHFNMMINDEKCIQDHPQDSNVNDQFVDDYDDDNDNIVTDDDKSELTKHNNTTNLNYNNIIKTNNMKNLKLKCSSSNEDCAKGVTQPLLGKINS